ncbi:MAG: FAD-dependent oxidoreductase [Candidatus Nitrosocosmicus sp.]
MEAEEKYDLRVIGIGTAGTTVAQTIRSKGWNLAIIDSLPFGGTCALRGCEPKKILVEAAKVVDAHARYRNKGIFIPEYLEIQWSNLIRFEKNFTEPFVIQRENDYMKDGIHTYHGEAEFKGSNDIRIIRRSERNSDSEVEWESTIYGKKIVIATGTKPVDLMMKGSELITTSDQFLAFEHKKLPNKIIFIGGGFISFEFAHIAARAGVKEITIIHRGQSPLNHFDPVLVKLLLQKCKDVGINVIMNTTIESIQKSKLEDRSEGILARLVNSNPETIDGKEKYQSIQFGGFDRTWCWKNSKH